MMVKELFGYFTGFYKEKIYKIRWRNLKVNYRFSQPNILRSIKNRNEWASKIKHLFLALL